MNQDNPQTLSDLHPKIDGHTADEIIQGRKFRDQVIQNAASKGNVMAIQTVDLIRLAKQMGCDTTYDERLDEEDIDCHGGIF